MGMENLRFLFKPSSVAIIGASNKKGKLGYEIVENLVEYGYKGKIYPINPKHVEILGLTTYPSVLDVPGSVDLAIVAVPAKIVSNVLEDCGKKGVKAVVVISSGFGEIGEKELEKKLVEIASNYGMCLLGPNVFGVVYPPNKLNASFGPRNVLPGNIAFITQSGALGIAIIDWAIQQKIGLSAVVPLGNKAHVDDADLLEYFLDDENTKSIVIYLEGVRDGKRFLEVATRVVKKKPVIVVKAGRSSKGASAAASHTGSLAGSDQVFSAAADQAGLIRAFSPGEAFDYAKVLSMTPKPWGRNVVILTNGGGAGVMATDACEEHGIHLLDDHKLLNKIFGRLIPYFGSTGNPIDVTGQLDEEKYGRVLRAALASDKIHAVLLIYCQAAQSRPRDMAKYIVEETRKNPLKPVITVFIGGEESKKAIETLLSAGIPSFPDTERAVKALAAYYRWIGYKKELSKKKELEDFNMDLEKIKKVIRSARSEGRTQLLETESNEICEAAGIKTAATRFCTTIDECLDQAEALGYPVVLKVVSEDITHKSDVGGVKVDLGTPEELRTAYTEIMANISRKKPNARIRGILVSKMIKKGIETIAGISRDPQFGPVVMFGLGGVYVEALKDVSFRVAPITKLDAHKMIHQIRASRILYGFRGETRRDINAIIDILLRLSQLSIKLDEIVEIDLNPLLVLPKGEGCIAVDTRITITKEARP